MLSFSERPVSISSQWRSLYFVNDAMLVYTGPNMGLEAEERRKRCSKAGHPHKGHHIVPVVNLSRRLAVEVKVRSRSVHLDTSDEVS